MVPDDPEFDAVAAAKELDELLGEPSVTPGDSYTASLETEIEELNALVAKKDEQLARANARAEHAHAEIEAAGKRLASASSKELEQRTRGILENFLPVVDDLDRAIASHRESAEVIAGLELVRRNLLARFGQYGVTHAPALGAKFDPQRHDALSMVPVSDPAQDGRVIAVMREGYNIGDAILRPAGVAVGKRT
jgi:molecular chaperone GrpE